MGEHKDTSRMASRQYKAQMAKAHASMKDKIKEKLMEYTEQHPQWTPEDLVWFINRLKRHYALRGRYYTEEEFQNATNTGGTEASTPV